VLFQMEKRLPHKPGPFNLALLDQPTAKPTPGRQ
jgi:hypothetical protein